MGNLRNQLYGVIILAGIHSVGTHTLKGHYESLLRYFVLYYHLGSKLDRDRNRLGIISVGVLS